MGDIFEKNIEYNEDGSLDSTEINHIWIHYYPNRKIMSIYNCSQEPYYVSNITKKNDLALKYNYFKNVSDRREIGFENITTYENETEENIETK